MVLRFPVGVSVLCVKTDPACQSNGQPYNAAAQKKKEQFLTPADWDMLAHLCEILEVKIPHCCYCVVLIHLLAGLSQSHS
jgi:hypothetical protein